SRPSWGSLKLGRHLVAEIVACTETTTIVAARAGPFLNGQLVDDRTCVTGTKERLDRRGARDEVLRDRKIASIIARIGAVIENDVIRVQEGEAIVDAF